MVDPVISGKRRNGIAITCGFVLLLLLFVFMLLDWRVKDVCKWSHFEEIPSFSQRIDLISSIFKINTYHVYFVQDYQGYSSREKLLDDIEKNQKHIIKQLKTAGLQDGEIEISLPSQIDTYEESAHWSADTKSFGINGVTIDIKTKNKKLYNLFSNAVITVSHQPKTDVQISWPIEKLKGHSIHQSSRPVFSFSFTSTILKALDCTRVSVVHQTLIEKNPNKISINTLQKAYDQLQ